MQGPQMSSGHNDMAYSGIGKWKYTAITHLPPTQGEKEKQTTQTKTQNLKYLGIPIFIQIIYASNTSSICIWVVDMSHIACAFSRVTSDHCLFNNKRKVLELNTCRINSTPKLQYKLIIITSNLILCSQYPGERSQVTLSFDIIMNEKSKIQHTFLYAALHYIS